MSSIRRESFEVEGSSVRKLLETCEEVVEAPRNGNSLACVRDGVRKLRVLVVDDNRDCADSLSQLVSLWGIEVRTAYDGAAALALMDVRRADVVLLDLSMPRMDGCQMARQLRRQTRFDRTMLIAVTGWTDEAHRLLGKEAGFDHYLLKPIELGDLEILLRHESCMLIQMVEGDEPTEETRTARENREILVC